ncbi:hypothetical protein ACET3Z_013229 [Daucus carota]
MERAERERDTKRKRKERERDDDDEIPTSKTKDGGGETNPNPHKAKSCKGCLYYSSALKSHSSNPLCIGITRSLPQVPCNIVGKSEMEANEKDKDFAYFKYGCVGYSVYSDRKGQRDVRDKKSELPACIGIEHWLIRADQKKQGLDTVYNSRLPQPRTQKPTQSVGDEFLERFSRNAGVVANGVAKNLRKVGNQLKSTIDEVSYPYHRRPK